MKTPIIALRMGMAVNCPADRGNPAYTGKVAGFDRSAVHMNLNGTKYIWVTVREGTHGLGAAALWPSHRLGFHID